jgi:hypothetical protein
MDESLYEDASDGIPTLRPVSRSSSANLSRGTSRATGQEVMQEASTSNQTQGANAARPGRGPGANSRRASVPIVGTDSELFSENSIAGRKRELELAHMQYFKVQTENIKEATEKIRADRQLNELAQKKLQFEVDNLQIDKRIKLLTERKLELQIFKAEIDLSRYLQITCS